MPDTEMPEDRLSDPDNSTDVTEYVETTKKVAFSGMPEKHGSLADKDQAGDRPAEGGKRAEAPAKPAE